MLENYEILPNGVIKQIKINKINYDFDYSNKYNNYGEKSKYLSYLRLGVLLGNLNFIPNSLVDIGYGNGDFLKVCFPNIKNLFGCDISDYPVPDGCLKISINEILNDASDSKNVDVCCFFDSLEHFEDISFIKNLNTKYIYISVPWCHYLSDDWFSNWYHRRENEHLYHFNKESLINFFKENGYSCIYTGSHEDIIRINKLIDPLPNILSAIFIKN
jgi:hypothetical protein